MCQAKNLGPVLAALLCGAQAGDATATPTAKAAPPPPTERVGAKPETIPPAPGAGKSSKSAATAPPPLPPPKRAATLGQSGGNTVAAPVRALAAPAKAAQVAPSQPPAATIATPADPAAAWTATIAAGNVSGAGLRFAADLARHLSDGADLRVRPVVTAGETENLQELSERHSVDLAIVHADALANQSAALRPAYLLELHLVPIWILARSPAPTIEALAGRVVAAGPPGSGAATTAPQLFARLGLSVDLTTAAAAEPCEALQSGDAQVAVIVAQPFPEACLPLTRTAGVSLVPVPLEKVADLYAPITVDELSVPGLVAAGATVETVGVTALLVAERAPADPQRARRIGRLIDRLAERFDALVAAQPSWRAVQIHAQVPGWLRHPQATVLVEPGTASAAAQPR